ncbi:hypothetical protein BGZ83_008968 [Gryganskiella cystojenkinii]|nr:hypothetical protein BGZ83_008968 [Gryganskiella cystojenkinii]
MDGAAFQGMPRIALTPAEEALIPRPHSSASQVASAVPSTYSRTSSSPGTPSRHPHHPHHHNSLAYHPYYNSSSAANSTLAGLHFSPSSASIPLPSSVTAAGTVDQYSRPASPSYLQQPQQQQHQSSSLSNYSIAGSVSSAGGGVGGSGSGTGLGNNAPASSATEQEYPQNPQDGYYSQVPPQRPASPGPSRLAFSLSPRPARSPSPQLYGNLYDHNYQPRTSYFSRGSYDAHPRPGSPLQQEHQESWDSSVRMDSPSQITDSEDDEEDTDSDDEGEGGSGRGSRQRRPSRPSRRPEPKRSNSKNFLRRLKETTSRLSFGDDASASASQQNQQQRPYRTSQESDQAQRNSRGSSSTSLPGKEILQDLSDEEKQQEPRKSRSAWRPSLSLIRQESDSSNVNMYLQNDPNRISGDPNIHGHGVGPPRRSNSRLNQHHSPANHSNNGDNDRKQKKSPRTKNGKKKKRGSKKKRAEKTAAAARQLRLQQLQQQQQAKEEDLSLPTLLQVLEKKTRYPLSYDDFEAFLRSCRAVEYLNFWTDVTAHEQLCRTFDVSERRQKRELQLEERAIARDRRRMALLAAMESGKLGLDADLLSPGHGFASGTGIGIGASGQEIDGSNLYLASRSSLQLPLNDHLSFPQESRRYGIQDSSAPFPPPPPTLTGSNSYGSGAYNRLLSGIGGRGVSEERSRPSLEEERHISEQDAAVAAVVALKNQRKGSGQYDYITNTSREDVRRGSFDLYRPLPTGGPTSHMRYQQNNNSSSNYIGGGGGAIPSANSSPNAYNLLMRGRGSVDILPRSNSRNGNRMRPSGSEDYFGNGVRQTSSQQFQSQQQQQHQYSLNEEDEGSAAGHGSETGDQSMDLPAPLGPRRQMSHHSLSIQEPEWGRRPSLARISGSVGPLQAPVSIRRSGESAYAPSVFSTAREGNALLVQSFRTISLEDLQESALRIYRKYLIQLRTAPMAAEEEVAAAAAATSMKARNDGYGNVNRASLDKAMAPGWDGYAEEVIAQWNENWRGRRANRLSGRRSIASRGLGGGGGTSGQTSTVGDEAEEKDISSSPGRPNLTVQTGDSKERDAGEEDDENIEDRDPSTEPKSPISPRMKKRAGTGLSSVLPPFLSRLLRTEVTVVELPTLTINTTTVEETAVPEESEEDSYDEEDDEEDYDSDEEDNSDEDDEQETTNTNNKSALPDQPSITEATQRDSTKESPPGVKPVLKETTPSKADNESEEMVILDRSMPTVVPTSTGSEIDNSDLKGDVLTVITFQDQPSADIPGHNETRSPTTRHRRHSSASSLSSSWDRVTKRDIEKSVTILPLPVTASLRSSPYKRGGVQGVRARTGRAANMASKTAQRVGWQLSALLNQSKRQSSSASLDTIRVTPATSPRLENHSFQFQIPAIVMSNSSSQIQVQLRSNEGEQNRNGDGTADTPVTASFSEGHPLTSSSASHNQHDRGEDRFNDKMTTFINNNHHQPQGSTLQPPKPYLSPATSNTNPTMSNSTTSSPTPSNVAMDGHAGGNAPSTFTIGSSPAAVAVSAAAAAFYLPLECRQRIHTQVQEEGRTEAPYLFGPAKGFVLDVVLQDHYYPLFLKYVEQQNLGLLNKNHPNNQVKRKGSIWIGILVWIAVLGLQIMLVVMDRGGWKRPWVYVIGVLGGWPGSIFLATGLTGFSPLLGFLGRM